MTIAGLASRWRGLAMHARTAMVVLAVVLLIILLFAPFSSGSGLG